LLGLLLIAVTLLAYLPALHGGFIWDDDSYVTANPAIRSSEGLKTIWLKPEASPQYYPLVFTTFWLEYHFWKLQPFGYHLVNILLHASNAVLLWLVLRQLKISGAWWAAAIFALHPVMAESVAWITERKNVLSVLFYLLAVLAYFRFRPLTNGEAASAQNRRFYPLVLALFLCALLSKTVTCSLPAALLLLVWWQTGRLEKRDLLALAPLCILGAALGFMTAWLEKVHVGASGEDWTLSFVQRCLLAGRALWFYAGKLFWPHPLIFIYPHWQIDAGTAWQYLFLFNALAVVVALWLLRQRIGKGPLVAVLYFAGTLAPALGFINVYPFRFSFVADHFQYLASIGLIALIVSTVTIVFQRFGSAGRIGGTIAAAIMLLMLGSATWIQTHDYNDIETLWQTTIARNPGCWMAHNNLGVVLGQKGQTDGAISQYQEAIRLKPDYAEAHYNLGNTLGRKGQTNEAISQYREAIRLKPNYAEAHSNLGTALEKKGQTDEAISQFQEALRLVPNDAEVHYNLGNILGRKGQTDEAISQFQEALRLKPDFARAHYGLGTAFGRKGQTDVAVSHYRTVIQLKPDYADAHGNLAKLLAMQGKLDEAVKEYQRTLELAPNSNQTHFQYGQVLQAQHHFAAAKTEYQKAFDLKPENWPVCINLAWLLATCPDNSLRDGAKAVELAKQAGVLAGTESPQLWDTLAAAYAEAGRFGEAVETAKRALNLPITQNDQPLAEAIQSRLKLYEAHTPYHEKP
jgi:tetratricopeptide (TPR) repeat protein